MHIRQSSYQLLHAPYVSLIRALAPHIAFPHLCTFTPLQLYTVGDWRSFQMHQRCKGMGCIRCIRCISPFGLHLIHLIHLRCKGVKVHIRQSCSLWYKIANTKLAELPNVVAAASRTGETTSVKKKWDAPAVQRYEAHTYGSEMCEGACASRELNKTVTPAVHQVCTVHQRIDQPSWSRTASLIFGIKELNGVQVWKSGMG